MTTHELKRQKTKRYKVVKSKIRYSCAINGRSKYALQYLPGTEVYARSETIGVMCFKNYKWADLFISRNYLYWSHCKIVEVLPMGKGRVPNLIANPSQLDIYYNDRPLYIGYYSWMIVPEGTICYPAVYVLN